MSTHNAKNVNILILEHLKFCSETKHNFSREENEYVLCSKILDFIYINWEHIFHCTELYGENFVYYNENMRQHVCTLISQLNITLHRCVYDMFMRGCLSAVSSKQKFLCWHKVNYTKKNHACLVSCYLHSFLSEKHELGWEWHKQRKNWL